MILNSKNVIIVSSCSSPTLNSTAQSSFPHSPSQSFVPNNICHRSPLPIRSQSSINFPPPLVQKPGHQIALPVCLLSRFAGGGEGEGRGNFTSRLYDFRCLRFHEISISPPPRLIPLRLFEYRQRFRYRFDKPVPPASKPDSRNFGLPVRQAHTRVM